ncbi:ribbon-helix-helix domain-containing protein [Sphingobium sp. WTD-1]|uniref:ribbon-helix-helix domain-containing protein n=1 Tax=Sphingobium sp. WTD-1 TaxID=2979467 RepID=UPI0024DE54EC|nr:ribbon-helix-helix domain-containing protein [Sphingobium sp. WTD-1]WIA57663.1 ribbon-helix-helix domain-containing protein [Sphingobium sp. WTD-1]
MAKGDASDGAAASGASPFAPPVKRSVTIAGHQTAISLEPIFWQALRDAAGEAELPINALIARIDVARIAADDPPNLASAIRCWLFARTMLTDSPDA